MLRRVDIDETFYHTELNPMKVHTWEIFRDSNDVIHVKSDSKASGHGYYKFIMNLGSIFLVNTISQKYAYFRHKEFQDLVDSFNITKVRTISNPDEFSLRLTCGILEEKKDFKIYTDGEFAIEGDETTNVGKDDETHTYTISFSSETTWAIVDMYNNRHVYREFLSWGNPHKTLMTLDKNKLAEAQFSTM